MCGLFFCFQARWGAAASLPVSGRGGCLFGSAGRDFLRARSGRRPLSSSFYPPPLREAAVSFRWFSGGDAAASLPVFGRRALWPLFLFSDGGLRSSRWALLSVSGCGWVLFARPRTFARSGTLPLAGNLRPAEDSSPGRELFTRLNRAGTMIFEKNWLNL